MCIEMRQLRVMATVYVCPATIEEDEEEERSVARQSFYSRLPAGSRNLSSLHGECVRVCPSTPYGRRVAIGSDESQIVPDKGARLYT